MGAYFRLAHSILGLRREQGIVAQLLRLRLDLNFPSESWCLLCHAYLEGALLLLGLANGLAGMECQPVEVNLAFLRCLFLGMWNYLALVSVKLTLVCRWAVWIFALANPDGVCLAQSAC